MNKSVNRERIIVSLTSFPEAIPYATQAIRSVLKGTLLPDKVVLYLDTQKFPEGKLPPELEVLKTESPIFEVRFDDAVIRSYKKLIPALRDFPNDVIVTIDDDIRYHPSMLNDLVQLHEQLPHCIIAHRVRKIKLNAPYKAWRKYKWYDFIFKRHHFNYLALQTGVGGVLYPPHSLDEKMLDSTLFMKMAPTNDDIWFWAAAVSKGTHVVPVPGWHPKLIEIGKPGAVALKTVNIKSGIDRNREALEKTLAYYPAIKQKLENGK